MPPLRPDHAAVERTFRALLTDHGLPEPDEVSHWRDSVVFGWSETKAIVVVDLDEADDLPDLDARAWPAPEAPAADRVPSPSRRSAAGCSRGSTPNASLLDAADDDRAAA